MKSHHRFSGILLAGILALATGTPASALTDAGKNLLERLRNRIEEKDAAAAKQVETVAPPVEFKTQAPPAQTFEPGSIQVEPSPETGKKKEGEKKAEKSSSSRTAKKAKSPKEPKADKGKFKADLEKIIKALEPPAEPPVAPPATKTEAVSQQAQPAADTAVPAAGGSARSFGELSDAELIQYANDHMWTQEKSRKHNPPYTPPSKPKKKKGDKEKAAAASTKKAAKKTGSSTTKTPASKGKS